MEVWMVTYAHDYSKALLGIFSTKEKALDYIENRCGMKPKLEDGGRWSPITEEQWAQIFENGEEFDVGTYGLKSLVIDQPIYQVLYAE